MIKYTMNGNVTVARVTDCRYDAIKIIARRFPAIKRSFKTFEDLVDNIKTVDSFDLRMALMSNNYSSVVRLHESDTYNEETGKKMASRKLNAKIDKEVERRIRKWVDHQHLMLDYGVMNQHLNK